jgi:hypothetical protein
MFLALAYAVVPGASKYRRAGAAPRGSVTAGLAARGGQPPHLAWTRWLVPRRAFRRLAPARGFAQRQLPLPGICAADDVPIAGRRMSGRDAEDGLERDVPIEAAVEGKDELVEVSLDVLAAQVMIDAELPALHQREDPVHPGSSSRVDQPRASKVRKR